MQNIVVIFGGKSVEHDISIITGLQVISNLKENHNVIPIYISREGIWLTGKKLEMLSSFTNFCMSGLTECHIKPHSKFLYVKKWLKEKRVSVDCAILALHGANGEDGSIQGLLELSQIPYVGSSGLGSALTMDKAVLKMLLFQHKIPTPNFVVFTQKDYQEKEKDILAKIKNLGKKVVVKPDRAGSSIGVKKCETQKEIKEAIEVALCFDNKIIVEEAIEDFREVNIACLGLGDNIETSCLEEVVSGENILSFEQKYIDSKASKRVVDVKLCEEVENKIKEYAKRAFTFCELSGVCRFDFFVKDKEVYLNEINSIPGSMANYLFKNMTFTKLIEKLIIFAKKKYETRNNLTYLYKSEALIKFGESNGKMQK